MNTAPILEGADLGYGAAPVLRGVTLALVPGERVAILGRSGAGKSTLLTALFHALQGQGRRVALIPQDHALVPQLSALRNVLMGRLDDHGAFYNLSTLIRPRGADRRAAMAVLGQAGLGDAADHAVETLSGGQKQRTALARALYRGGDVLLGDEPLSAIDPVQAAGLAATLRQAFPTAVLALHDVDMALDYATRIVGLKQGAILFDTPVAGVSHAQIEALYAQ